MGDSHEGLDSLSFNRISKRERKNTYRKLLLWMASIALLALATLRVFKSSMFALFPGETKWAISSFAKRHYCATAYFIAGDLALNRKRWLYDPMHYHSKAEPSISGHLPRAFSKGHTIDRYPYSPVPLLLPAGILSISKNLKILRVAWFSILFSAFLISAIILFYPMEKGRGISLSFLLGGFLASNALNFILQVGNIHPLVIGFTALGIAMIERKRPIAGGFFMAFASATKLWPGVVLLVYLFGRKWAPVIWAFLWTALLTWISSLFFGWEPFKEFLTWEVPRLADGRAFPFLAFPVPAASNLSIPSIMHKFSVLGWMAKPQALVDPLWRTGWISVVLISILWLGFSSFKRNEKNYPSSWRILQLFAIVCLAQLGSPYLSAYFGNLSFLILLGLLMMNPRGRKTFYLLLALFIIFASPLPKEQHARALWTLSLQVLILGVSISTIFAPGRWIANPEPK